MTKILFIIDIDNTLADNIHREELLPDWEKFFKACDLDTPITPIIEAITPYLKNSSIKPIFLTGRGAYPEVQEKTQQWLQTHVLKDDHEVYYRPLKDFRKANIFKESVVKKVADADDTIVILDDDIRIIDHFKNLGHKTILVDNYNPTETATKIHSVMQNLLKNKSKPKIR